MVVSFWVATCTGQQDEPLAHFLHLKRGSRTTPSADLAVAAEGSRLVAPPPSRASPAGRAPEASSAALGPEVVTAHSSSTDVVVEPATDAPGGLAPRDAIVATSQVALVTCATLRPPLEKILVRILDKAE